MLIHVDKLRRRPRRIEINEKVSYFPVIDDLVKQGLVSFESNICGELEATWAGGVIKVSGSLETQIVSSCARCLSPVAAPLDVSFTLCYIDREDDKDDAEDEEVELQDEDLGLISYEGLEIDLKPDVEQEIIMALPQQQLCGDRCKGLCPVCGCNLNQSRCSCEPPVFHAGLNALRNFKVEK